MILNSKQRALLTVLKARVFSGLPNALLLEGVAGSGKTQFAKHLTAELSAKMYRYDCRPDKERNILYDYDVQGILDKLSNHEVLIIHNVIRDYK